MIKKRINFLTKKLSLALIFSSVCIAAGFGVYYNLYQKVGIYDFNDRRDTPFVLDIFKHNWEWLIAGVSPTFAPDYVTHMLHNRTSRDFQQKGAMTIKVLYQGRSPAGFVSYYKKKFYEGRILFLGVLDQYRSKGYGYQLFKYAMNDLIAQGCTKITLVTRTTNYPAMKVYTRAGFKEIKRDDGFVDFEYQIK